MGEKKGSCFSRDFAYMAGLSICHFSRQFKQSTGLSPHQYLLQCRVEQAKSLLHEGGLTIAEIAHEVGLPIRAI